MPRPSHRSDGREIVPPSGLTRQEQVRNFAQSKVVNAEARIEPKNAKNGRLALGRLISFGFRKKAPAGNFMRGLHFSHCPSHIITPGRPCFYLAVLIKRPTSAPRYDILELRNMASHVSPHVVHTLVGPSFPICERGRSGARWFGRPCAQRLATETAVSLSASRRPKRGTGKPGASNPINYGVSPLGHGLAETRVVAFRNR